MDTVNKYHLLDRLENQVESHLQEAIRVYQNAPEATLLKPATDGGWSIAQCLQHLNAYGQYYLPQIKKGFIHQANQPNQDTFTSTWLGSYFTRMMDPATNQKRYKAFKDYSPAPALDAHAVIAEFIQQQEELIGYLKKARTADLNKIKVPVSIAKWLKLRLGDVFQFLIAHNQRHMLQAKRHLA
ncbi:DinB family protein [Adhaeribacter aquaticus]|uniref:DinB family protein n=1 Tax=Adhaeribacter aquaticus TaxID=299567 RepID=UPI00041394C6|nr:DinB family protein [Adhaeribacter aquaticus]